MLTCGGHFKYASIDAYRHEQCDHSVTVAELDSRRLDRTRHSDTDYSRYRPPFFIEWIRRPRLGFVQQLVEDRTPADSKQKEYAILLEMENHGKHRATNCRARFTLLSQEKAKLPPWGVLKWIYEDGHPDSVGNLSYKERARIELLTLKVTETTMSEGQVAYRYETGDGIQVTTYVGQPTTITEIPVSSLKWSTPDKTAEYKMTQALSKDARRLRILLDIMPVSQFRVSIYGDDGLEKFGQVKVIFGSKPKVEPILDV